MKGDPKVIQALRKASNMEAALAAQYHLDKRNLKDAGFKGLGHKLSCFAEECEDIQNGKGSIVERMQVFGVDSGYVTAPTEDRNEVQAILAGALTSETAIAVAFNEFAIVCVTAKDDNTRNRFEHWIKDHEDGHIVWLERQLGLIKQLGLENYLSTKV